MKENIPAPLDEKARVIDNYVKKNILSIVAKIDPILKKPKGTLVRYYEGFLLKDVQDNFPKNKTSKLFTEINSYLNNRELMFYQKRNGDCDYEYYVKKLY